MEDAVKDQSSAAAAVNKGGSSSAKLLRYPLRSSTKSKEEKSAVVNPSPTSVPRRGRPPSSVSKSVSVLEISSKEKSAKPPRRLSIQAKSTAISLPKTAGNVTPISEARAKRPVNSLNKSETPTSEVSRSANRKKYCALSSASYWLTQIKLSESAAKHSISLGFFKLALEAGCEIQRLRDELKTYARRYNLVEFGECAKELLASYNIMENVEQLQVSETYSQVPEEGTKSSDDDTHSSSSVTGTGGLKPKCLNTNPNSPPKDLGKVTTHKTKLAPKIKPVANKKTANSNSNSNSNTTSKAGNPKMQKKSLMPSSKESVKQKNGKNEKKKNANEEGSINPPHAEEEECKENKENVDAPQMEEISLTEV